MTPDARATDGDAESWEAWGWECEHRRIVAALEADAAHVKAVVARFREITADVPKEIVITPAMIEAGAGWVSSVCGYCECSDRHWIEPPDRAAVQAFVAMTLLSRGEDASEWLGYDD